MEIVIPETDAVFDVRHEDLRRMISEIYTRPPDIAIVAALENPMRFKNGKILNCLAIGVEYSDISVLVDLDPVRVVFVPREKFIKTVREAIHRV